MRSWSFWNKLYDSVTAISSEKHHLFLWMFVCCNLVDVFFSHHGRGVDHLILDSQEKTGSIQRISSKIPGLLLFYSLRFNLTNLIVSLPKYGEKKLPVEILSWIQEKNWSYFPTKKIIFSRCWGGVIAQVGSAHFHQTYVSFATQKQPPRFRTWGMTGLAKNSDI